MRGRRACSREEGEGLVREGRERAASVVCEGGVRRAARMHRAWPLSSHLEIFAPCGCATQQSSECMGYAAQQLLKAAICLCLSGMHPGCFRALRARYRDFITMIRVCRARCVSDACTRFCSQRLRPDRVKASNSGFQLDLRCAPRG